MPSMGRFKGSWSLIMFKASANSTKQRKAHTANPAGCTGILMVIPMILVYTVHILCVDTPHG